MNQFRKYLLIGLITLSLGTATCGALAEDPGGDSMPPESGPCKAHEGKFAEHVAKHLAKLHDQLKLTEAQEGAWQTFVKQMTPTAPPTRPDWSEWSSLPAPERMDKLLALMQARQNQLANRASAVKAFYKELTPEQQKIFNEQFVWHPHHHGERHQ